MRSSLYWRFMISFSIAFVLPTAILFVGVYRSFLGVLSEEASRGSRQTLHQIQDGVDRQVSQLIAVSYQIQETQELRSDVAGADVVAGRHAIRLLRSHQIVVPVLYEIVLYHRESRSVYSSAAIFDIDSFATAAYSLFGPTAEQLTSLLRSAETMTILPLDVGSLVRVAGESLIAMIVPLLHGHVEKTATVAFVIREEMLLRDLRAIAPEGTVIVTDRNGALVTSVPRGAAYLSEAWLTETIALADDGVSSVIVASEPNVLTRVVSDLTGWSYMTLVPLRVLEERLRTVRRRLILQLVSAIVIGAGVAYAATQINYRPILGLKRIADAAGGEVVPGDELDAVRTAIEHLQRTSSVLRSRVDRDRDATRDRLLVAMLSDDSIDRSTIVERLRELEVELRGPRHVAVRIAVTAADTSRADSPRNPAPLVMADVLRDTVLLLGSEAEATGYVDGGQIVIVASGETDVLDRLDALFLEIQRHLLQRFDLNIAIGIGDPRPSVDALPASAAEARIALDQRFVFGSTGIVNYSAVAECSDHAHSYPTALLDELQLCVMNADGDRALNVIQTLMSTISDAVMPLFMARTLCFDILSTVHKSLAMITAGMSEQNVPRFDLESLIEFDTAAELAGLLEAALPEILGAIRDIRRRTLNERVEELKRYIEGHFRDPTFSAKSMADRFGVSVSNLSHYFGSRAGTSISDYTNALRMGHAKKLLRETNLTVQEIVESLGYLSASSFIRKFRIEVGMTPGQYRACYPDE